MATKITNIKEYVKNKSFIDDSTGCHIWKGKLNHLGRAVFPESIRERMGISVMVSRYVLSTKVLPQDPHLVCMHLCDNPPCVNPEHLKWGTQAENLQDMTNKGRRAVGAKVSSPGVKNPRAKISEDTVNYIRTSTKTNRELARELKLSDTMISGIKRNLSWRHI